MGRKTTRERVQLTDRFVKKLQPGEVNFTVWDDETRGLGVQVTPQGLKIFSVKYSLNGRQAWATIGAFPTWTTDQARARARELRQMVDKGQDPRLEKKATGATVAKLLEKFLAEHVAKKRKARTLEGYTALLDRHVTPTAFAKRLVKDVTPAHVATLHAKLGETPYMANRVVAVLSAAFELAETWGMRKPGTNPCRGIERYTETKRQRFLTAEEMERLGEVLRQVEPRFPSQVALTRLLLLTGARLREVLNCRWSKDAGDPSHPYLDKAGARIVAPDHKGSRRQGAKSILLSTVAMKVIKGLEKHKAGPYLFPSGSDVERPLANPHHFWITITDRRTKKPSVRVGVRDLAGLPNLRFHDLRHSFGALSTTLGQHPVVLSKLMGHASPTTTLEVYAHAALDPQREAVEKIGAAVAVKINKAKKIKN